MAGILLRDLILGRSNPWAEVYDPGRLRWRAVGTLVRENANVLPQYADWIKPGEVGSVDDIPKGGGAVIRRGMKKLAVHRDEQGALHTFSAVCPHLGCVVRWSGAEMTWDCPCHGSRFNRLGGVINGPANTPLKPVRP